MKKVTSMLGALSLLSLAACGTGGASSEGDMSQEESARAFDESGDRTSGHARSAQNSAAFTQGFDALAQEVDVDVDADCADGGTAALDGSMSIPDGQTGETSTEMNLSIGYASCAQDGVTLDGNVDYYFSSATDQEAGSTTFSSTMEGQLDFSGDIEGSCTMDVAIDASMTFDLETGSIDVQVDATGSFCGHAVEDLDADMTSSGYWEEQGGA